MNPCPIYVAATRQHVGKTTTCLAVISGLSKRFPPQKVGYMKPVGQQHVTVYSTELNHNIRVDKDVSLVREHFALHHIDYQHMSPVLIPSGYTRQYVDGTIDSRSQLNKIKSSFITVNKQSHVVLCEGTGHAGVGSIIDASNSRLANLLNAQMVLVVNGGIGSAFDELELNRILCQRNNVPIAGVIMNKVKPDKYERTKYYISTALKKAWDVPLLGCIPDRPYLGCPALVDLERLFDTTLLTGKSHRFWHYTIHDINLVTTSLSRFKSNIQNKPSRTLYLCHVTRDDIICSFFEAYERRKECTEPPLEAALIICGRSGKYTIGQQTRSALREADKKYLDTGGIPVMACQYTMHEAMEMIHDFTPKLNACDVGRVNAAVEHYEQYIDFDLLLERTKKI